MSMFIHIRILIGIPTNISMGTSFIPTSTATCMIMNTFTHMLIRIRTRPTRETILIPIQVNTDPMSMSILPMTESCMTIFNRAMPQSSLGRVSLKFKFNRDIYPARDYNSSLSRRNKFPFLHCGKGRSIEFLVARRFLYLELTHTAVRENLYF
jgi:hypothetical protein